MTEVHYVVLPGNYLFNSHEYRHTARMPDSRYYRYSRFTSYDVPFFTDKWVAEAIAEQWNGEVRSCFLLD